MLKIVYNSTIYLNYSEDPTGNTSYTDENNSNLEIQANDVFYIYYTTTDNFNSHHSVFLIKLKLDTIDNDNNEYKFILNSLDDDLNVTSILNAGETSSDGKILQGSGWTLSGSGSTTCQDLTGS